MATRPKAVIESRNGEKFSPITIAKNVLTDDGQNLHDILSDRKEDMMTPTIENSSSMFKVGQGDDVDYSTNVVNGAYESCVLKGVTKFIDNNTGETLDSFVENRDLSLIDCKSPILSNVGKNLFTTRDSNVKTHPNHKLDVLGENHIEITAITNETGWLYTTYEVKGLVPNTTYILSGDVSEGVNNSSGSKGVMLIHDFNTSTSTANVDSSNRAIRYTTPKDVTKVRVLFYSSLKQTPNKIGDTYSFKNIQLEKAQDITTYEPYKSNILSCNGNKIELTEDMFEQGGVYFAKGQSFANATNNTAPDRIRLKTLLNLKPNTTYRVAIDNAYKVGVQLYNNEKLAVSDSGWVTDTTFTTKGGEKFVALVIRKLSSAANISMSDFKNIKLQLSEVDKTIVLRSLPNGVCDTLNVRIGEYVQRIGEVVLDGSDDENWNINNTEGTTTNRFISSTLQNSNVNQATGVGQFLCDKLKTEVWNQTSRLGLTINKQSVFIYNVSIDYSASAIKQWLSQNPVTVQYELATPIVKQVNVEGYPYAYENGHVLLESGSQEQSLTPTIEYSVVTNRNGQIRSNQKMVERHQKQLDRLQAMILTNLVNTQYEQTLTNLKYDLKNVREEVK